MNPTKLQRNQSLKKVRRQRFVEQLEPRLLMNSDWRNPVRPLDVNNDMHVSPIDALIVINALNTRGSSRNLGERQNRLASYLDTNGDRKLSPLDALLVIDLLNTRDRSTDQSNQRIDGEAEPAPAGFVSIVMGNLPGTGNQIVSLLSQLTIGREEFNEMGLFVVDGPSGAVNGVLPGSPAYADEVFSIANRQVLYSKRSVFRTAREVTFPAGATLGVYVLQESSSNGDGDKHLRVRETGTSEVRIGWEEHYAPSPWIGVGDRGFDDVMIDVIIGDPVDGNAQPVIGAIPNQFMNEEIELSIQALGMDADSDDILTYSFDIAPTGATIDPRTGLFRWTPTESQGPGNFEVVIRATDRQGAFDTEVFSVTVLEVNRPPVLQAISNRQILVGQNVAISASANDPDQPSNLLNFRLAAGAPVGATINPVTGAFSWSVPASQSDGPVPISIIVNDNGSPNMSDSKTFIVTVSSANRSPQLSNLIPQQLLAGTTFSTQARAVDPDGDQLTYSLGTTAPSGTNVNPGNGLFSWTPSATQIRDLPYVFDVIVTDSRGAKDSKPYSLSVGAPATASLLSISPADGESLVSLTRETVVQFTAPVNPTTVTPDSLYLIAKGERIPGTIRVSPTKKFATYFYNTALPESTEVRVVVDGEKIVGIDGKKLDADNDGLPGGMETADFTTLPLTLLPGTKIWGYVYDSYNTIPQEKFPIPVPVGDPQFDPQSAGNKTIAFSRVDFFPSTGTSQSNPRLQPNKITSVIDANMVYGSDEQRARALRRIDGSGKLKTTDDNLLPTNDAAFFPDGTLPIDNKGQFPTSSLPVAGDVRAAEVPTLTAIHTLFVREHNRKADEIKALHSNWSDEEIYQSARQWVGALIQQISYQEYLPTLIGSATLPAYSGYKPSVDPSVTPLFATAAFRLGHTQQSDKLLRLDATGQTLSGGPLSIRDAFFNPNPLTNDGIDPYLRGLLAQQAQDVDLKMVDDLRNFLFGAPGSGGMDLAAINIARGRDFGLPDYNLARVNFGLPRLNSFSQITSNVTLANAIQSVYGSIDNVDVWVGGLAEDHIAGGAVGPLFSAIIKDQFIRSRDGDRLWFENGQFTQAELTEIRGATMAALIRRNSGLANVPDKVFTTVTANPATPSGGTARSASVAVENRSYDGYGNNLTKPQQGQANQPMLINYTLEYGDGKSSPGGADRPGARSISNSLFGQSVDTPNTLGLTELSVVWGQFLAHDFSLEPAQTARGSDIPVVGATISLDALPNVKAITDQFGYFELTSSAGLPAPEFFVHIDGSTAINAPSGAKYATLGKPFHSIPGKSTQLTMDGSAFNVYLPPMAMADIVTLTPNEDKTIGFGSSILGDANRLAQLFPELTADQRALLSQTQVTYPAGSAKNENGVAATLAMVIPVNPDRLPAPLPPGVDPGLVISIQAGSTVNGSPSFNLAGGSTNFDIPAPVQFPNLDGLAPGEQSLIWSFDHDAGRWTVIGNGTVTPDGKAIVSNPGVGVLAPGWHFTDPGTVTIITVRPPRVPKDFTDSCKAILGPEPSQFEVERDFINKMLFGVAKNVVGGVLKLLPSSKSKSILEDVVATAELVKAANTARQDQSLAGWFGLGSAVVGLEERVLGSKSNFGEFLGVVGKALGVWDVINAGFAVFDVQDQIRKYREEVAQCASSLSDFEAELAELTNDLRDVDEHLTAFTNRMSDFYDSYLEQIKEFNKVLDEFDGRRLNPENPTDTLRINEKLRAAAFGDGNVSSRGNLSQTANETLFIAPRTFQGSNPIDDLAVAREADGVPVVRVPAPTAPFAEVGDTIATAQPLTFAVNQAIAIDQRIGDGTNGKNDIDLYEIELQAGEYLSVEMIRKDDNLRFAVARLFDASGTEVSIDVSSGHSRYPAIPYFQATQSGKYYIGISGFGNTAYSLGASGTATGGIYEGAYRLMVSKRDKSPSQSVVLDNAIMSYRLALSEAQANFFDGPGAALAETLKKAEKTFDDITHLITEPASSSSYVSITNLETGQTQRFRTNESGSYDAILPSASNFQLIGYDPSTKSANSINFATAGSGTRQTISLLLSSSSQDIDNDQLSDDAERVFGTKSSSIDSDGDGIADSWDTDGDGVSDGEEVLLGTNPLGNEPLLSGVIASLSFPAESQAIATINGMAFVATGSHGLGIVDTSQPERPIILGQIDLPDFATDVAIDEQNQLAFISTTSALQVVSYADPMDPKLLRTIAEPTQSVITYGELAIIANGNKLIVVDPNTAEVVSNLTFAGFGNTKIAREGTTIYAFTAGSDILTSIDIVDPTAPTVVGSVSIPVVQSTAGLYASKDVVWIAGGGLVSVDVGDPSNMQLISDRDQLFQSSAIALNGSGLGLVATDTDARLSVYDVRDPSNTNNFSSSFALSGTARDVAISRGIAYSIAGNRIEVVNYAASDRNRIAPTVNVEALAFDVDASTPGNQIIDGARVAIRANVTDDTQIRQVEFLINDQVVYTDIAFPFDPILTLNSGTNVIRARAMDTVGNISLSEPLTIASVPDTFAPEVVRTSPRSNAILNSRSTVTIEFSERMDAQSLTPNSFRLESSTIGGSQRPISVTPRNREREVDVVFESLAEGDWEFVIESADLKDRAGNAIAGGDIKTRYKIIPLQDAGGTLPTARHLGDLLSEALVVDSLTPATDNADVYSFDLLTASRVSIQFSNLTDSMRAKLIRVNTVNGVPTERDYSNNPSNYDINRSPRISPVLAIAEDLLPGRYYVVVEDYDYSFGQGNRTGTTYTLEISKGLDFPVLSVDPGPDLKTNGSIKPYDLRTLNTVLTASDAIMQGVDDSDVYTFQVDVASRIELELSGHNDDPRVRLVRDVNGDQLIDGFDDQFLDFGAGSSKIARTQEVLHGQYFIVIDRAKSTPYSLKVTKVLNLPVVTPVAGEDAASAHPLGLLTSQISRSDILMGLVDPADVYSFRLDQPRTVRFAVTGQDQSNILVRILRDQNSDGNVVEEVSQFRANVIGANAESLELLAGTYYVELSQGFSDAYTLTLTPGALIPVLTPDPGNNSGSKLSDAFPLGDLNSQITRSDMIGRGFSDPVDVYSFKLNEARSVEFRRTMGTPFAGFMLDVVRDLDGDGNPLNDLKYAEVFGGSGASFVLTLLPETYYLVVRGANRMTSYTLTLIPLATIPLLPNDPSNVFSNALNLGTITETVSRSDMVARGIDEKDFYKFKVESQANYRISLSGQSTSNLAFFRVYRSAIENGQTVLGQEIATGEDSTLDLSLGDYFILIEGGLTTPYTLKVEKKA